MARWVILPRELPFSRTGGREHGAESCVAVAAGTLDNAETM
jgi:hypothetical protein